MTKNNKANLAQLRQNGLSGLSRRGFLGATGASTAGLFLMSCSSDDGDGPSSSGGTDLMEAPQLTEMVEAGEIPPLEERLPANPLVVDYVEGPGVYGGTWNAVSLPNNTGVLQRYTGYTYLVRWNPDYTEVVPDVAEEYEINLEGTEARFKLREGIKWSDGEPFTADDVLFAANDVLYHPEVNPGLDSAIGAPGSVVATAEDDYVVHFKMDPARGLYLRELAGPKNRQLTIMPRHYLEQFHADYNEDIDELVEQEGAEDWVQLFTLKGGWESSERLNAVDCPVITPWKVTEAPGAAGTSLGLSRNPYFWKVDPDGRQLPYIDNIEFSFIDEPEVMVTAAANGEVDMYAHTFNIPSNKPVLAESRESGGYDFFDLVSTTMNNTIFSLNQTSSNPVLREAFQKKDFRIGISHAINRQEIIDVVFQRQGEPWQAAPREDTEYYDEEFAKQFTEFDLELAVQHLESAGYGDVDGNGNRLWPDGSTMAFMVMVSDFRPEWLDVAQLLVGHLAEVGITLQIDNMDRSLFNERIGANEHDASFWEGDSGGNDLLDDPRWYFPFHSSNSQFAVQWALWYSTDGEQGEEPPEPARRQMQLYDEIDKTGDEEEQEALMTELLGIAKDEFYTLGIAYPGVGYGIVKNNFHNVPASMFDSYYWQTPGPTNPEQYFIEG